MGWNCHVSVVLLLLLLLLLLLVPEGSQQRGNLGSTHGFLRWYALSRNEWVKENHSVSYDNSQDRRPTFVYRLIPGVPKQGGTGQKTELPSAVISGILWYAGSLKLPGQELICLRLSNFPFDQSTLSRPQLTKVTGCKAYKLSSV